MDDSEADFFGDAGKEKRTLVDNLPASVDEEAVMCDVVDDVAGVVAGAWHCCSLCCSVDDIDASDSAGTNAVAIDVTVIVDVDVGVVGVVVIVIVIVAVDVLGEQLLVVPSCPSPFPTVPLLCLVCEQFSFRLCQFYIFFSFTRCRNFEENFEIPASRRGSARILSREAREEIFWRGDFCAICSSRKGREKGEGEKRVAKASSQLREKERKKERKKES